MAPIGVFKPTYTQWGPILQLATTHCQYKNYENRVDIVASYLARARGNLVLAQQPKPEGAFWEDLCYQAHQAAEKALKAVLISRGVNVPWTHSIEELLDAMPPDLLVDDELRAAASLTFYGTTSRYPMTGPSVTEEKYQQAIAHAERVLGWAEQVISKPANP